MICFVDIFHCPVLQKTQLSVTDLFPYSGQRFWRHILSSTLQNLLFLAIEQFSTYLHNLSPDCGNRHSTETALFSIH